MSLDVWLNLPGAQTPRGSGIFVRENGANREITREEWDERFPDREPVAVMRGEDDGEVYAGNVTHNLNRMASAAGIYEPLWRPDEIGITKAAQLIEPLRAGLALLRDEPQRFTPLNPENGWGTYDGFVTFVAEYLTACERYPDADVRVWR